MTQYSRAAQMVPAAAPLYKERDGSCYFHVPKLEARTILTQARQVILVLSTAQNMAPLCMERDWSC